MFKQSTIQKITSQVSTKTLQFSKLYISPRKNYQNQKKYQTRQFGTFSQHDSLYEPKQRLPSMIENTQLSQFQQRVGSNQNNVPLSPSSSSSIMMGSNRNSLIFGRSVMDRIGLTSARQPSIGSQMQYSTKPNQKQPQCPSSTTPHVGNKHQVSNTQTVDYHSRPASDADWYGYFSPPETINMSRHGIHTHIYSKTTSTTATTTTNAAVGDVLSVWDSVSTKHINNNNNPIEIAANRGIIDHKNGRGIDFEINTDGFSSFGKNCAKINKKITNGKHKHYNNNSPEVNPSAAVIDVIHSDTCHFNKSRSDASLQGASSGEFDLALELSEFFKEGNQRASKSATHALNKAPHDWKHTWE
jgi:hypothetical protein